MLQAAKALYRRAVAALLGDPDAVERFTCLDRYNSHAPVDVQDGVDYWDRRPNGDRCCSHCGSLHEDDFIAVCLGYANGEPGFHFEPSTKGYKRYANMPGTHHAGQGGMKFYTWHMDTTPGPDLDRRAEIYGRAIARWEREHLLNG